MVWTVLIPLAGQAGQVPLPERTAPDLSVYPWLYLRDSEPPSRRLGFACDSQTCRPVNVPQTPEDGAFRTGAIDLTGDGVAEQVRLEEQQVIIYRDGIETWRGLPEWRVVDLALGDPNDDGRNELLLALWKPDAAGVPRDSTEPSSRASRLSSTKSQAEGLTGALFCASQTPNLYRLYRNHHCCGAGVAQQW